MAGFLYDRLVSETADLRFRRRIGAFFSALEIRFPGNGDRSRRRLGSNGELLARKPEHLVLARPFGRQIGEADNSHAMRKAAFDRRLDEVGREEGEVQALGARPPGTRSLNATRPMRFLPGIFSSLRRRAAGAPHCIVNPSDWLPFRVRGHPRKEKKGRGVRPLRPFAFRECAPH